jgi:hypothetical protein
MRRKGFVVLWYFGFMVFWSFSKESSVIPGGVENLPWLDVPLEGARGWRMMFNC